MGKLTHLHYAFAKIDPTTGKVVMSDPAIDRTNIAALKKLKQTNRNLKTLISIGGWADSAYFSNVAATAEGREVFAESVLDFILANGFDGVDIDWEYPVSGGAVGNINHPQDKQNFTQLLQAIRDRLNRQSAKGGRTYLLAVAGAANNVYLSNIEPARVAALVDYIFVMTYDMHGPWDRYADFNAPLYQPNDVSPQYKNSVYDGIMAYLNCGVSARKLILGMPFYGYRYDGVNVQNNGLFSTYGTASSIGYDEVRSIFLNNAAYTVLRHGDAQVPYLYGNGTFVTYEDPQSIAAKAALAKSMGLGGVGAWSLSHDAGGTLLSSAYSTLFK